jgi:hypothetical protein
LHKLGPCSNLLLNVSPDHDNADEYFSICFQPISAGISVRRGAHVCGHAFDCRWVCPKGTH